MWIKIFEYMSTYYYINQLKYFSNMLSIDQTQFWYKFFFFNILIFKNCSIYNHNMVEVYLFLPLVCNLKIFPNVPKDISSFPECTWHIMFRYFWKTKELNKKNHKFHFCKKQKEIHYMCLNTLNLFVLRNISHWTAYIVSREDVIIKLWMFR